MDEERPVPAPITEHGERMTSRDYGSAFARLPADEVHPVPAPGAGPLGGVDGPKNVPVIVFFVGIGLFFLTFFVGHWAPLVAGLAVMLVGAVWAMARQRPIRLYRGVGTIRKPVR